MVAGTKGERREGIMRALDALERMRRRPIRTGAEEMVAETEYEQSILDGPAAETREMRRLSEEGLPDAQIADRFELSEQKVRIITGKIRKAWIYEGKW
jgi:hypothetical protein